MKRTPPGGACSGMQPGCCRCGGAAAKPRDQKGKSVTEALVNSFGSYPIGYCLGIVILPLSMGWLQEDLLLANVFVTLIYATVSFVRTYYLRRAFERLGFDDNFLRLLIRAAGRIGRAARSAATRRPCRDGPGQTPLSRPSKGGP